MHIDDVREDKNSYIFVISQKVKHTAPGKEQPVLSLPVFKSKPELCVASVLEE